MGKTTTIGKLGHRLRQEGKKVLFCASDTFRAAAADQLEIWAGRAGAEIVRQSEGSDPGAVLFDAMQAAKARGTDVVLVDTAGRLHNKQNLMNELAKLRKIVDRGSAGGGQGDAADPGRHHGPERPDPGQAVQGNGGASPASSSQSWTAQPRAASWWPSPGNCRCR